ncbi:MULTISPECIES: hypothetical protein [unclassified Bradyrhizobium]|uniref:hypothetical protein n=1 Tax=unclassified Bradyrhizobium TaxID=2631580 RepID=UPI0028F08A00|nr:MULTISPECIES: hypothetical protein [unclassified Bradyrhizobium]
MIDLVLWLAVISAVVLVWFVFRQGGYKRDALSAPPGPAWIKTEERFVDPTSGETLDVWFHPRTGERAYVRAGRSV